MKFGEQSPIEIATDGMENFDSEQISEDDTSEILAHLSKEINLDPDEEEKQIYNEHSKMDNSFDKVSGDLSGMQNNKLQVVHKRKLSKTKRKLNLKHEPLSKHIPKDILQTNHFGASKNLLGGNRNLDMNVSVANQQLSQMSFLQGTPKNSKFITPDVRHPRVGSIVNDELPYKKPSQLDQSKGSRENYVFE